MRNKISLIVIIVTVLALLAVGISLNSKPTDELANTNGNTLNDVSETDPEEISIPPEHEFVVFPSPDQKLAIMLEYIDKEYITEYIDLNPVLMENGQIKKRINFVMPTDLNPTGLNTLVIWLSNNEVLLSGHTIYNVSDDSYRTIETIKNADFLGSYAVNPQKTKIAIHGRFTGRDDLEIGYVDLKSLSYTKIYSFRPAETSVGAETKCGWDYQDNLYFDTAKADKPTIKKYDGKQISDFMENTMLPQLSPDGTMIGYIQTDDIFIGHTSVPAETIIFDLKSNKELMKVLGYGYVVWGNEDRVVGIVENETVHVFDLKHQAKVLEANLPSSGGMSKLTKEGIEANIIEKGADDKPQFVKKTIPLKYSVHHLDLSPEEELRWMEFCKNAMFFLAFSRNTQMDEKELIFDMAFYLLFRYRGADRNQLIEIQDEYPVIKKETIDRFSQEFFGRKVKKHQSIMGFKYKDGKYYCLGLDDHNYKITHIQAFVDNNDGTFTVEYDFYLVHELDESVLLKYPPEQFIYEIHRQPDIFPPPFAKGRLLLKKVKDKEEERYIIIENLKTVL